MTNIELRARYFELMDTISEAYACYGFLCPFERAEAYQIKQMLALVFNEDVRKG